MRVQSFAIVGLGLFLAACGAESEPQDSPWSIDETAPGANPPAVEPDKPSARIHDTADPTPEHRAHHELEKTRQLGERPNALAGPGEFIVHEWGTFTSVQGSNGEYIPGLHHEEEPLPAFVHTMEFDGIYNGTSYKSLVLLPEPVLQKLETPVIYFYSDEPLDATVSVDFPDGLISEWYPSAEAWGPGPRTHALANGTMDWEVSLSNSASPMVEVPPEDIWAPSREVPDAMYVSRGDETDKFIFYRGVGRFEPPFRVTNDGQEYVISNLSAQRLEHVYLLEVGEDTGHIYELDGIDGFGDLTFNPAPKEAPKPIDQMVREAKTKVARGLVATGLTQDEADAMVNTWSRSYFRTPGRRILYTVPREWTDALLPMSITPEPTELVRTLVGRVEAMTPAEEAETVEAVQQAYAADNTRFMFDDPSRFSEPRIRRACQLVADPTIKQWCMERAGALMESIQTTRF